MEIVNNIKRIAAFGEHFLCVFKIFMENESGFIFYRPPIFVLRFGSFSVLKG